MASHLPSSISCFSFASRAPARVATGAAFGRLPGQRPLARVQLSTYPHIQSRRTELADGFGAVLGSQLVLPDADDGPAVGAEEPVL
jgi:hypothetical protein